MNLNDLGNYGLALAGIVAGFGALGWGGKKIRDLFRWGRSVASKVDALNDLAQYELRPNHGGSMKDHAAQVPVLAEQISALDTRLTDHLTASTEAARLATEEQRAMWQAIEAVAKAQPPEV